MTELLIDTTSMDASYPSLCIPRVFNNITEERIHNVFNQLMIGEINHIDIVARKNEKGESFKRVYIHFTKWFINSQALEARNKLILGKEIKIVYENPWFWKVSANKWVDKNIKPNLTSNPSIVFEDTKSTIASPLSAIAPPLSAIAPTLSASYHTEIPQADKRPYTNRRPNSNIPSNGNTVILQKKVRVKKENIV